MVQQINSKYFADVITKLIAAKRQEIIAIDESFKQQLRDELANYIAVGGEVPPRESLSLPLDYSFDFGGFFNRWRYLFAIVPSALVIILVAVYAFNGFFTLPGGEGTQVMTETADSGSEEQVVGKRIRTFPGRLVLPDSPQSNYGDDVSNSSVQNNGAYNSRSEYNYNAGYSAGAGYNSGTDYNTGGEYNSGAGYDSGSGYDAGSGQPYGNAGYDSSYVQPSYAQPAGPQVVSGIQYTPAPPVMAPFVTPVPWRPLPPPYAPVYPLYAGPRVVSGSRDDNGVNYSHRKERYVDDVLVKDYESVEMQERWSNGEFVFSSPQEIPIRPVREVTDQRAVFAYRVEYRFDISLAERSRFEAGVLRSLVVSISGDARNGRVVESVVVRRESDGMVLVEVMFEDGEQMNRTVRF